MPNLIPDYGIELDKVLKNNIHIGLNS
jgi:hypothetical protein